MKRNSEKTRFITKRYMDDFVWRPSSCLA